LKRPNRSIELWVIFIRRVTFTHEDGSLLETLKKAGLLRAILRENNPSLDYEREAHPIYRRSSTTAINGASIGTVAHNCQSPIKHGRVERRFGNRRERRFSTARVSFTFKGINA